MAWIQTVDEADATGTVKTQYDAAIARAGSVYNIVKLLSARPKSMHAATQFYFAVMREEDSPLTRMQRELIATIVSKVNNCHY